MRRAPASGSRPEAVGGHPTCVALPDPDEALNRLAAKSSMRAERVKLQFFAGLSVPEPES